MEKKLQQSNCESRSMDRPYRSGRILRHWTTNALVFMGKATTKTSNVGDWGLAHGRRLNLIGSKLKSLAGGAGVSATEGT
jgi:hypothetical protein